MEVRRKWVVCARREEAPDAVTLELKPADNKVPVYLPGQYLTFIFDVYGQEKRRAYSISSAPGAQEKVHVTVKRIPNGEFSTQLVRHVEVGDVLEATGPSGRFVLPKKWPKYLVFIAGGSGITPIMSHLRYLLQQSSPPKMLLIYANRDSVHTIFKSELDAWAKAFPGVFTLRYVFSRERGTANAHHGHLNQALLDNMIRDWLPPGQLPHTHYFICAPIGIQRMAEMCLRVMDVPDGHLHSEQFVPDTRLKRRTPDPAKRHKVKLKEAGISFDTYHNETILSAALRQGISLPYTCKTGTCFTCLQELLEGEVEVAFVDQTLQGKPGDLVNTCIGYAVSDEVVLK